MIFIVSILNILGTNIKLWKKEKKLRFFDAQWYLLRQMFIYI
jgi:hypothetical protein